MQQMLCVLLHVHLQVERKKEEKASLKARSKKPLVAQEVRKKCKDQRAHVRTFTVRVTTCCILLHRWMTLTGVLSGLQNLQLAWRRKLLSHLT